MNQSNLKHRAVQSITLKVSVLRAISAVVARRAIRLFSIIGIIVLVVGIFGIWALAHFLSVWWWLLLIIYVPFFIALILVYSVVRLIVWRIYPSRLSRQQTTHLEDFSDKILRLVETRGIGWWWFTVLCIKELILYRELRTLKSLLLDATSLREDFKKLEDELGLNESH